MTTKGEWITYTGSDEQIAELENAKNGFICKNDYGYIWDAFYIDWSKCPIGATHYFICNPHPLADMICQQARTGQPVWIKHRTHWDKRINAIQIDCTTTPNWNISGAEYSFTLFEEDK